MERDGCKPLQVCGYAFIVVLLFFMGYFLIKKLREAPPQPTPTPISRTFQYERPFYFNKQLFLFLIYLRCFDNPNHFSINRKIIILVNMDRWKIMRRLGHE